MNLINEDTHICNLNLYKTIFQNWCLIDELNSLTPTPDADALSEASKNPSFTDNDSTHLGDTRSEDNLDEPKIHNFTGSYLESTYPKQIFLGTHLKTSFLLVAPQDQSYQARGMKPNWKMICTITDRFQNQDYHC